MCCIAGALGQGRERGMCVRKPLFRGAILHITTGFAHIKRLHTDISTTMTKNKQNKLILRRAKKIGKITYKMRQAPNIYPLSRMILMMTYSIRVIELINQIRTISIVNHKPNFPIGGVAILEQP